MMAWIDAGGSKVSGVMRTTRAIDDDRLTAAKAMAQQTNRTIGEVVSALARRASLPPVAQAERNGMPLLPVKAAGGLVTLDIVNALSDWGS